MARPASRTTDPKPTDASRASRAHTARGTSLLVACALAAAAAPAALAQPLPSAAPEKVGMSSERLARIGKALNQDVEQGKLPGAVVLVARKGKVVYFDAFGFLDKPAGKRMPKDAIFRVYSMTKPWTSVAAMMLVEEGRIQLTDPVSKFLPALKGLKVSVGKADPALGQTNWTLVPADREPTIQDLLRHTSGFAYDFVTANAPVKEAYVGSKLEALKGEIRDVITASEMVERLSKAPLAFQPGTTWDYSLSTAILGRVIEAVSGMRLSRFLEERLFAPLRMTDSGFSVPQDKAGRIAQPLLPYAVIQIFDPTVPPANDLGGEGGMSTASDYLRFAQMLLDGGKLGNARILSRSTVALMTADHLGPSIATPIHPGQILLGVPGYTFGLGFMVRQGAGVAGVPGSPGEFMWGGAAGTFFWVDPKEQLAVVYMSQGPFGTRAYYRRLVKQLVSQAIVD
jgi:CubicO group peptidase (beta-lactamase class C family)